MMERVVRFFVGFAIIAVMGAMLVAAALVFNGASQINVDTYFFQPRNLSYERLATPARVADLGADRIRKYLIEKYVTEYFYVIPDVADVDRRMKAGSVLQNLSTTDVFDQWVRGTGAEIRELAENNVMRMVRVTGDIVKQDGGDFWVVPYETVTWPHSNEMGLEPVVESGVLLLSVWDPYILDLREKVSTETGTKPIIKYLNSGGDPAAIFRFGVTQIGRQQD